MLRVLLHRGTPHYTYPFVLHLDPSLSLCFLSLWRSLTKTAKTGQALIAHPLFNLLPEVEEAMDVDSAAATPAPSAAAAAPAAAGEASTSTSAATPAPAQPKKYTAPVDPATNDLIPEAVVYLRLLLILAAIDAGKIHEAGEFALETANIVQQANRRAMDQIAAKIYFYLARAYEMQDRLAELRP